MHYFSVGPDYESVQDKADKSIQSSPPKQLLNRTPRDISSLPRVYSVIQDKCISTKKIIYSITTLQVALGKAMHPMETNLPAVLCEQAAFARKKKMCMSSLKKATSRS